MFLSAISENLHNQLHKQMSFSFLFLSIWFKLAKTTFQGKWDLLPPHKEKYLYWQQISYLSEKMVGIKISLQVYKVMIFADNHSAFWRKIILHQAFTESNLT